MSIKNSFLSGSLFFMIIVLFFSFITAGEVFSSEDIEEEANVIKSSDSIITGEMNDYSKSKIVVDYIRYNLCEKIKVFTHRDHLIPLKDINAAEEVKLFINKRCVRKIKVLRFAQ